RGVRITPGPITLVIDLGYRWYAPRRRQGRSHARFPGARTRTRASCTTDAKREVIHSPQWWRERCGGEETEAGANRPARSPRRWMACAVDTLATSSRPPTTAVGR